MLRNPIVIGLTGSFGSGCSFIAKTFIEPMGYKYLSLSDELRKACKERNLDYTESDGAGRTKLQDYGDELRKDDQAFLAKRVISTIEKDDTQNLWVVDSIRNLTEVETLRKKYTRFYLVGVFAEADVRWERKKSTYKNNRSQFDEDDKRDSDEGLAYGQQVTQCFRSADYVINNNEPCQDSGGRVWETKRREIARLIDLINNDSQSHTPTEMESNMAMAYAVGQRSTCLKRHVGAVIVDGYGNIFSSGYNEVPWSEKPCLSEYGNCFRDIKRKEFLSDLHREFPADREGEWVKVENLFKERWKVLDICRALHGEERAILNLVQSGGILHNKDITLYTTTYPCNLCANKIVQIGIKKIVYFEPYPVQDAKITLSNNNVKQEMFTGVTFNSYFKFFGRRV